jgi:hypothetical protein
MDEKLITTIYKIKLLAEKNTEFRQEMQKLFGKTVSASVVNLSTTIQNDIAAIRSALEIRANASITYSFVNNQRLRDQLIIDNLRMENAALNLKDPEEDRFYIFCVNAFYQVENILNYFYHMKFNNINSLLTEIEESTQDENNDFIFKRTGKEINVSSIHMAHKINAFCNAYLPKEKALKWSIGTLRQVRNEGAHRCDIIRKEKDEKNNIYQFLSSKTFNLLRIDLKTLVNTVELKLSHPDVEEVLTETIKSMLPSMCYVSLRGDSVKLPQKLFVKVKSLQNGDKVKLTVLGNKLLDIEAINQDGGN